ncbi:MAG: primosomal protein N' [Desulfobacterales bacterium]|nr:MAG: primosomal protein N' [Desulfobacterales bacterium]
MTRPMVCIDVAIALPVYNTFTYSVPENYLLLVAIGKRVLVPFRRRRVTGYTIGAGRCDDSKEIKHILDVLDDRPLFPESMLPFFRWIADYYKHPLGEVIKNALPGGLNLYDIASIALTERGQRALADGALPPLENEILCLLEAGPCSLHRLRQKLKMDVSNALIHSLAARGRIVQIRELRGGRTKPKQEPYVALADPRLPVDNLSPVRKKIIAALQTEGELAVKQLRAAVRVDSAVLKSMVNMGQIHLQSKRVYRDPFGEPIRADRAPILNREQQMAVSKVGDRIGHGFAAFLLKGVTGSGKTEVYLQLAAAALSKGYSALVLVPEIVLITQMERRFRARFGDRVAILHSGLSTGERFDQWTRIVQNDASIAIGARSAIFAPLENIAIIIVDEEHDPSYKQDSSLRYNARDLALVRAKLNDCVALLGSATPSIQSYFNVTVQKFQEVNLERRVAQRPLPEVHVVDLRQSRDTRGVRRFISVELQQAMQSTLERGEQVLLFLNRRGYASFPVCAACGQAIRCKRCDISLTLHQSAHAYKCHYCGFTRASVSHCDLCGSTKIKLLGFGTEKVEAAVKKLFPDARVARMDRDTTARKGAIVGLLKGLRNRAIDILVGTQMVAKGHDFPNITLVGIICADLSLSFPDFRAGERTFQLLAQVSGRAGRGAVPGRVILQTYNPDHFSIVAAKDQDFMAFYAQEISLRQALHYPPFSRMIQLKILGKDKEKTKIHALSLGDLCRRLKTREASVFKTVEVMGPIEAALSRIADYYRWQILLKGLQIKALHDFVGQLLVENSASFSNRHVKVVIDVDPFFLM